MLPFYSLAVAAGAGSLAGVLIGSIGVGGIVIVPILIQMPIIDVQMAVASAMVSYIAAGSVGMLMYARKNSIEWSSTAVLLVAAAPAAFAGSYFLQYMSDIAVKLVLYTLVLLSSILALVRTIKSRARAVDSAPPAPAPAAIQSVEVAGLVSNPPETTEPAETLALGTGTGLSAVMVQVVVGGITGFGSALTGTSGPVVSMPMLLLLRWPIRMSLGSAQAVQLPIASASTLCYIILRPGTITWELAVAIALGLAPCAALGAVIAHKVPEAMLKLIVSSVLVLSAVILVTKLLLDEA